MVIDKTTGRGCAWSIASKTVTKRLIAENIMDKLIFIKGLRLKELREAKRLSQTEVAKRLNVGRSTISGYVRLASV